MADRKRGASGLLATAAILALMAVGACTARVDDMGQRPQAAEVEDLRAGVHSKSDVAALLGTPSSLGTFDDSTWYYIHRRTEAVAFFDPEVTEQQVLAIHFDPSDRIDDIQAFDLEDGQDIQVSERETPTRGEEMSLMQQLYVTLLRGGANNGPNEGFVR